MKGKVKKMKSKLTSRKFWISVASFLMSFGTAIGGMVTDNELMSIVGVVCGAVATAIYTIVEGVVDASHKTPSVTGSDLSE